MMRREPGTGPARRFWRRLLIGSLAGLVLIAGAAGAIFAGFQIGKRELFPLRYLERADAALVALLRPAPETPPTRLARRVFPSAFFRLTAEVVPLNTAALSGDAPIDGWGGGLTSFGADVLVLAYNGWIYAASGPGDVRRTALRAPDNNRAAYLALAEDPAFAGYEFQPGYLRYNDLAAFDGPAGRGLLAAYTEYHPDRQCYTNTLARLDIAPGIDSIDAVAAAPGDWTVIFRSDPCLPFKQRYVAMEGHMAGGRLAMADPATVYMTSGDFHFDGMRADGPPIAQDPQMQYGKILAIDLPTGTARIVSTGHRNPQGIAVVADGTVFSTEHGPRGGDELNLILPGANYGWPLVSYGITYRGTRIPGSLSYGRHEGFAMPAMAWVPSLAIGDMTVVDGFDPAWQGDLLIGTLIDEGLLRVRVEDGRAVYAERIAIGARIRAVHQHGDGRLVLWTDDRELVFLSPQPYDDQQTFFDRYVAAAGLPEPVARGVEQALARCTECHSLAPQDDARAPSLATIHGAPVAATAYPGYSDALKGIGGIWTEERLAAFLADPQAFAPGTTMPAAEIRDPAVTAGLLGYLRDLSRTF